MFQATRFDSSLQPQLIVKDACCCPIGKIECSIDRLIDYNWFTQNVHSSRPISLHFSCQHFVDGMDPCVEKIYEKIFDGSIQQLFTHNNACVHPHVADTCGNQLGFMHECRCGPLDRVTNPSLRAQYEDRVIATITDLYKKQPFNDFNIAVFASGRLLGELILSVRLIRALSEHGFKGSLNLFLIDQVYQDSIQKAYEFTVAPKPCGYNWNYYVGGRQDFEQFLLLLTQGLPSTIRLNGALFASDSDYIRRAQMDSKFQCDLVIGEDTLDDGTTIGRIHRLAKKRNIPGIVLDKLNDLIPQVCEVDDNGFKKPCMQVFPLPTTTYSPWNNYGITIVPLAATR